MFITYTANNTIRLSDTVEGIVWGMGKGQHTSNNITMIINNNLRKGHEPVTEQQVRAVLNTMVRNSKQNMRRTCGNSFSNFVSNGHGVYRWN